MQAPEQSGYVFHVEPKHLAELAHFHQMRREEIARAFETNRLKAELETRQITETLADEMAGR